MKDKEIEIVDSLFSDACQIIEEAQSLAYKAINVTLIKRNWLLGMRMQHEVMRDKRAEYGERIVKTLARKLTRRYGKGFTWRNLYNYLDFYEKYSHFFVLDNNHFQILHAARAKSENKIDVQSAGGEDDDNILNALRAQLPIRLTWTHYRIILQVANADARAWYENEAANEMWGTRTLQRNVSSQYYDRILASQHKQLVHDEMIEKTTALQTQLEFVKNPIIAEFLGYPPTASFTENELEESILNNLQKFIMELGKGYAFVARQQHIHTEKADYYIDLVFYNYLLKSFVLVDLKTNQITHQDVGQMDMYVRMYDDLKRTEGDNPTIGIVICADTDEDIARYSVMHDNNQLFAAKYKTLMPTNEELKAEIEAQKTFYYLQHSKSNNKK